VACFGKTFLTQGHISSSHLRESERSGCVIRRGANVVEGLTVWCRTISRRKRPFAHLDVLVALHNYRRLVAGQSHGGLRCLRLRHTPCCLIRPPNLTIYLFALNLPGPPSALMYGYNISALRWTRRMGKCS